MNKYKLIIYAFILDLTALASLGLENEIKKIFIFMATHLFASLIITVAIYLYFLPNKYKSQKFLVILFFFNFTFFIPILSYIALIVFYIILRTNKKSKRDNLKHIYIDKLFLVDEVQTVKRSFGEGALITYINNKHLNQNLRLKAFLIVSEIISPQTMEFIKLGLSDPIDEIRLLSFSIINNLEKKLNNEIFKIEKSLKKKTKPELKLKLAKLYLELISLNIIDETFKDIIIQKIFDLLKDIKSIEAKIILLKIYFLKKDYKSFNKNIKNLTINKEIIPYLLEVSFYNKDYKTIKKLIKKHPELKFTENFYFIYRLWYDN